MKAASARSETRAHALVVVARAFVVAGPVVVGLAADDLEVGVEVDLDLAAVVQLDLDAVGGAVVSGLRLDDRAAAGVRECGVGGLLQVGAGQGLLVAAAAAIAIPAERAPTTTTTAPISTNLRFIVGPPWLLRPP